MKYIIETLEPWEAWYNDLQKEFDTLEEAQIEFEKVILSEDNFIAKRIITIHKVERLNEI